MATGRAQLTAHTSTEEFRLDLHTSKGNKVPLKVWMEGVAFQALPGATSGIATLYYQVGKGKAGHVKFPVYVARSLINCLRRCCANVISTQYGQRRGTATPPKGKK